MSNIIPPLVSSSPPPMSPGGFDDEDDEFGDFTGAGDISDGFSLPPTPQHTSKKTCDSPSSSLRDSKTFIPIQVPTQCNGHVRGTPSSAQNVDAKTEKDNKDRRKSTTNGPTFDLVGSADDFFGDYSTFGGDTLWRNSDNTQPVIENFEALKDESSRGLDTGTNRIEVVNFGEDLYLKADGDDLSEVEKTLSIPNGNADLIVGSEATSVHRIDLINDTKNDFSEYSKESSEKDSRLATSVTVNELQDETEVYKRRSPSEIEHNNIESSDLSFGVAGKINTGSNDFGEFSSFKRDPAHSNLNNFEESSSYTNDVNSPKAHSNDFSGFTTQDLSDVGNSELRKSFDEFGNFVSKTLGDISDEPSHDENMFKTTKVNLNGNNFSKTGNEAGDFGEFESHENVDRNIGFTKTNEVDDLAESESHKGSPDESPQEVVQNLRAVATDDDDLGDFETSGSSHRDESCVDTKTSETPSLQFDDDEFEDFQTPGVNQDFKQLSNLKPTQPDDDFGDFETPCSDLSVTSNEPQTDLKPFHLVDNFGDFKTTSSDLGEISKDTQPHVDDDFGDFETPLSNLNEISESVKSSTRSGDDFGDFSTSLNLNETSESVQTRIERKLEPAQHDDFGDFSTSLNLDETSKSVETRIGKKLKPVQHDEDFGDFSTGSNLDEASESVQTRIEKKLEPAQPDNFGDFLTSSNLDETSKSIEARVEKKLKPVQHDDNFGDFSTDSNLDEASRSVQTRIEKKLEPAQHDDFGDFSTGSNLDEASKSVETRIEKNLEPVQPDGDFGDFETPPPKSEDENFGNFANFESHTSENKDVKISVVDSIEDVLAKSEKIISDLFPPINVKADDYNRFDFIDANYVFSQIGDIETTNSMGYQWSKSTSQAFLLKSLNIDIRNILYGPRWNASMPRFAANLGFSPLEPVKSEIPAQPAGAQAQGDVPAAQFDWTGSGLENPLDYSHTNVLLDLEQLVSSLNIPEMSPQYSSYDNSPELDSWEYWLQCLEATKSDASTPKHEDAVTTETAELPSSLSVEKSSPTLSNRSLEFIPPTRKPESPVKDVSDDDDEFSNFQSSSNVQPSNTPSHFPSYVAFNMPLRETRIDSVPEPATEIKTNSKPVLKVDEDEFTDFQMSLPVSKPREESSERPVSQPVFQHSPYQLPLEPLKPTVLGPVVTTPQINWPEPGIVSDDITELEISYPVQKVQESKGAEPPKPATSKAEDDDWSDFVSVTGPVKPVNTSLNSYPTSHNTVFHHSVPSLPKQMHTASTQYFSYPSKLPVQNVPNLSAKQDDDDWSDFVSGVPTAPNGISATNRITDWSKPPQFTSWSADVTPNIITNPVHFEAFQSYPHLGEESMLRTRNAKRQQQVNPVQMQKTRNAIPSISALPELDFIAPKNKLFSKK